MPGISQILQDYTQFSSAQASAVCLGNFDGIHLAHQKILMTCLDGAKQRNLASVVFTFDPHPMKVLRPDRAPPLLFEKFEKRAWLEKLGFDFILEQKFDEQFSKMKAEDFVREVLKRNLKTEVVVVGSGFRFGYKAEGTVDYLRNAKDFQMIEVPPLKFESRNLSSSWIRDEVSAGNVEKAADLLGHPYFISGDVITGKQRGRAIGFPTANIQSESECRPAEGVYSTIFEDLATKTFFCSVTNIGKNPTFQDSKPILNIESHLLAFQDDLYNRKVRIYFLNRLRDEKKFNSVEELRSQIQKDVEKALTFFHSLNLLQTPSEKISQNLSRHDLQTQSFQPYGSLSTFFKAKI